jgi:hypothetical protein
MRITERRLRQIIRSVIKENLWQDAPPEEGKGYHNLAAHQKIFRDFICNMDEATLKDILFGVDLTSFGINYGESSSDQDAIDTAHGAAEQLKLSREFLGFVNEKGIYDVDAFDYEIDKHIIEPIMSCLNVDNLHSTEYFSGGPSPDVCIAAIKKSCESGMTESRARRRRRR